MGLDRYKILVQDFKFRQVLLQYLVGREETRRVPRRRISIPSMAVNATRYYIFYSILFYSILFYSILHLEIKQRNISH
jgi:hypothetical protein